MFVQQSVKPKKQVTPSKTSRPRPVLMTPIRRCGSHALRLRLNFSPDFYSPYPLHLVDFMPLVPLYGDLSDDFNYFQLIIDLVGLQNVTMVKWENISLDPVEIFERIKHQSRSVHRVAWEMLFLAGQQYQARIVMDKSLDNIHFAEDLIELFDDILFLNVVRDPRAQICSINKAIIHDFDILLNALTWAEAHTLGRNLAQKYPERVLTIRYEDFIQSQEAVLRKICTFFDIPFLGTMLDVSRSNEAQDLSVLSALWESNTSEPIPANMDKFKQTLSLEQIQVIESVAADHMEYYGYERMTEDSIRITESMIDVANKKSTANRKVAWKTLQKSNPRDYQLRTFRNDYLEMLRQRLADHAA